MLNIHEELDRLLRRTEAAEYVTDTYGIPCSPKTLAKLACVTLQGPPFQLAGRIRLYPKSGLDEWAQNKIGPLEGQMAKNQIRSATGRHYCRNPRCGSKLKAPVENVREAFCARGCHTQYYRKRCIACDEPMERKRESQQLCKRRKCKSQFAAQLCLQLYRGVQPRSGPEQT